MAGAINETIKKFFSAERLVFETSHWLCVVRPKQVTLGSTILMSKSQETSFGSLLPEDFADLRGAIQQLEGIYARALQPDKINYLALMMVDPNPHFHVLPRFASSRIFDGVQYTDASWPKPPDLGTLLSFEDSKLAALTAFLKSS